MNSFLNLLSGQVPGGILLFLLILFIVNLTLFFFYRGSKFFSKEQYKKKAINSSGFLIVSYIAMWFILRPVPIPESILFVPFQDGEKTEYVLSEILEQRIKDNLSKDFRLHRWEWLYQTCDLDSIEFQNYRDHVARKLKIGIIVSEKKISEYAMEVIAYRGNDELSKQFNFNSYTNLSEQMIAWLDSNFEIQNEDKNLQPYTEMDFVTLTKSKLRYLNKDYNAALKLLKNNPEFDLLKSMINLRLGIEELQNKKKSDFKDEDNKYFNKVLQNLLPIAREGNDTAVLNRILGELYLFDGQYEKAEIFHKKSLIQDPYDSRTYYNLYFLHKDRIEELGFKNRDEVLKKAVQLDNGFVHAIHDLANEYFRTGTASSTGKGTTYATETLNNFLKINKTNPKILNLLANIYLQIKETEKAINIYNKLISLGTITGEVYYNLGIGYFHLKDYPNAESAFQKSIQLNDYPDSYLYLGAINRLKGDKQKALYYYRERIKRQTKDDLYAKEAMKGIRLILSEKENDSLNISRDSN